ncbi:hypothetical protein ACJX0J_026038, partial [Zea mays]
VTAQLRYFANPMSTLQLFGIAVHKIIFLHGRMHNMVVSVIRDTGVGHPSLDQ